MPLTLATATITALYQDIKDDHQGYSRGEHGTVLTENHIGKFMPTAFVESELLIYKPEWSRFQKVSIGTRTKS
jgi:hypothetical protein